MNEDFNSKRIAKNTLMLYFRQMLIMLVSLYTVRVVLNVLGAEDYGIYNVVAGVVLMFSFLSGAMSAASQRFFSYDIGKNDIENLENTFRVILTIYFLFVLIVVVLAESIGLLFVYKKLIIPASRMKSAIIVYHLSIISFVFTLITIPYMSSIIAHENMSVYAYISIIEALLKIILVCLLRFINFDKLIVYGVLMMLVSIINTSLYRFYCKLHYVECKFRFAWNPPKMKSVVSFIGWNFFGAGSRVLKNQMIGIILNQFFGPLVNAARSISLQINNALASFSQNFSMSMRPQIVKSYAINDSNTMLEMIIRGCKFTYYLMYIFTLPLVFEMDFVLNLWLGTPPDYTIVFSKLILIDTLVDAFSYPIQSAFQATGKIKLQQLLIGILILLNLPLSYILLKLQMPAYSIYIIGIILTCIAFVVRLILLAYQLPFFHISYFIKKDIFPCLLITLITVIITIGIKIIINNSIVVIFLSVGITILSIFFIGIEKEERKWFIALLKKKVSK